MQLEHFFPYRLAVTAEAFSRQLVAVYGQEFGLSRDEWRLLTLVSTVPELDSLAIGQRGTLDKVQVSRAAKRLEEKGLITREVSARDRRLRVIRATPEGRALFATIRPRVEARAQEILAQLWPEEYHALDTGISALLRALCETADDQPKVAAAG